MDNNINYILLWKMFLDFGYIFQHFCSQTSAASESLPQKKIKKICLGRGKSWHWNEQLPCSAAILHFSLFNNHL